MCGRFTLHVPAPRVTEYFDLASCPEFSLRYNIAPTSDVLVVRHRPDVGRVGQMVRWGLVPSWAKDISIGAKLNNARGETVDTKPSFRTSFAKHRCLIPANGFYEWKPVTEGGKVRRQPYYVRPTDGGLFAFAGLLARWRSEAGDDLITTCIITTGPNTVMEPIHDRMPVILPPEAWGAWLGTTYIDSTEALKDLLVPAPVEGMVAYPVGMTVNRASEEGETLIAPMQGK